MMSGYSRLPRVLNRLGVPASFQSLKERLDGLDGRVGRYGSILMYGLLISAIAREFMRIDLATGWPRLSGSGFWIAFALYFWSSPVIEYLIIRGLWRAPLSGFGAILRKMVWNELVLSYLGDAYFFSWIRRELPHVTAPFTVVKDMAIISALMGSLATLAAIAMVWPLLPAFDWSGLRSPLMLCLALALASGGAIAFFRKSLLSLSNAEIRWIAGAFGMRIVAQSVCAVFMWWCLLPQISLSTWIVLTAVRMVSARLPLVPSKDLAFAAAAIAIVGPDTDVAPMIVLVTSLILLANIALAIILGLGSWFRLLAKRAGKEAYAVAGAAVSADQI